ncbi:aminotransferase class III-fold pyridoxal phosphate-dependent enzyme [Candidatus Peregrinibacteria bacterium]|nr:aminotransferase class III-fold pyridoxal phosphate-dependent enzyme [Candidatus Peregrinibacteria bacterium]
MSSHDNLDAFPGSHKSEREDTGDPTNDKTIPSVIFPPPGPRAQAVIRDHRKYVTDTHAKAPYAFVADHGDGSFVWDVDGNCYLDFATGIAVNNLGHNHPAITRIIQEQAGKLLHYSDADFYTKPYADLCKRLAILAGGDHKVFLSNSGTEAVEAAIKFAKFATGRPYGISFIGAFHGRSAGSLSHTASNIVQRTGFSTLMSQYVHHIPYPDTHQGKYLERLDELEGSTFRRLLNPSEVAYILIEPIQGEGGYLVPPKEYIQRLRRICDDHGILLIADEVQTGAGRTGTMFAMEHFGVQPDITTMAKGLGNGTVIGATISRNTVAKKLTPGTHSSTFGGNPVSCRAALQVLDELKNGVMDNAYFQGANLRSRLHGLRQIYPQLIHDIRGMGLMIGVDFAPKGDDPLEYKDLRDRIVRRAFESGLLTLGCGPSSIRMVPPLNINNREVDIGVDIFEKTLGEIEEIH